MQNQTRLQRYVQHCGQEAETEERKDGARFLRIFHAM